MSESDEQILCPYCSTRMEREIVNVNRGGSWLETEPKGIKRLFWAYFGSQAPMFEAERKANASTTELVLKCPNCDTTVIPGGDI